MVECSRFDSVRAPWRRCVRFWAETMWRQSSEQENVKICATKSCRHGVIFNLPDDFLFTFHHRSGFTTEYTREREIYNWKNWTETVTSEETWPPIDVSVLHFNSRASAFLGRDWGQLPSRPALSNIQLGLCRCLDLGLSMIYPFLRFSRRAPCHHHRHLPPTTAKTRRTQQ